MLIEQIAIQKCLIGQWRVCLLYMSLPVSVFVCKFWTCLWTCVCVGSGLRSCRESEQLAGLHLTTYWPALHSPVIQPNLMFPLGSVAAEVQLTSLSVQDKQVFSNLSKQFFSNFSKCHFCCFLGFNFHLLKRREASFAQKHSQKTLTFLWVTIAVNAA